MITPRKSRKNRWKKIPTAVRKSALPNRGRGGGSDIPPRFRRITSKSSSSIVPATKGGNVSVIMARASLASVAWRKARRVAMPRARSVRLVMRKMMASIKPHAMLHPTAPSSIVRTSSRPASAALMEQVKESAMISPNNTSEVRSIGSNRRLVDLFPS